MTLSSEVEDILHRAVLGALEAGHASVTPEHIALELIADDEAATYLTRCGTDLVAVESRLRARLDRLESNGGTEETQPTPAFHSIVEAATERTEADGRESVMVRDLFLALIDERDSLASVAILEATREPEAFEELRTYDSTDD
jgi:ATP-dependent Clp protease ATP-binding subunit ClpA